MLAPLSAAVKQKEAGSYHALPSSFVLGARLCRSGKANVADAASVEGEPSDKVC